MSGTASRTALSDATPGEDGRIGRVWKIKKEDVVLPPEISESFETWKADPSAFLPNEGLQIPSSPREHYDYTLSLRNSIVVNRIRWRFITTAYYDVISDLSTSTRCSITKEAVAYVVAVVCSSSSYHREEVENNITIWAKEGAKYRALAEAIGGTWCYFFLPSIGESNWTKVLTRHEIKAAGKLLVNLGIYREAQRLDAIDLGGSIATILRKPFESAVPLQAHGQMILSISPQKATNGATAVHGRCYVSCCYVIPLIAIAYENTHPCEPLKAPRLFAANQPPGEEYDQLSASRIRQEEVVTYTDVSSEGSSLKPPSGITCSPVINGVRLSREGFGSSLRQPGEDSSTLPT
ncbi:hypothetical protein EJ07DRAFT_150612 [Lizonia empirigonia]|nr:hypothetical protein EJ07DRAFT_150612 [Lizonia empirigonia]